MKKKLLVTATVLLLAGLVIVAGAFAAAGFDITKFDTTRYETASHTVEESFRRVEIDTKESRVEIKRAEDGRASVVCVEREKVRHTVSVEDGTLKITVRDERAWYERATMFGGRKLSVTVCLPGDAYDELIVRCSTGDVLLPASVTFGAADISVSTGDVDCAAPVTGRLGVRTSTGDVAVHDLHAGEIVLSTSTGKIRAEHVVCGGSFSASFGTGDVRMTDVTAADLSYSGSTGDAVLTDTVASGRLSIDLNTGDVRFSRCDAAEITVRTSTGSVKGTLRTAKTFDAHASTGSVDVPNTTGGRCEINTSTGDIHIRIEE